MTAPDLAIQIVNYKTKAFLDPLVTSILKDMADSKLTFEINILDNASGDNLDDIGQKWHAQNVHVYTSPKNGGFGAGHNILSRKTQARYVLLINPDMLFFEEHTIDRLMETLKQTKATVVGPRLLTPRSRHMDLHDLSPKQLKQQRWDHARNSDWWFHTDDKLREVLWVSGAAFLMARQQLEDIGGFDENFFLYFEELDLCYRLRKNGAHVFYDPSVQILHYSGAVASIISKYGLKSFLYFERKKLSGKY